MCLKSQYIWSYMTVNLPFLRDSLDHRSLVGEYAQYDLETFRASTPALQEAVKYWQMPVKSTHELVTQETHFMLNYAAEIEIVRQHLWRMHAERQLAFERDKPKTLADRTFTLILSIKPQTKRMMQGIACLIVSAVTVFFLIGSLHNPILCVCLAAASVILITAGITLLILSRRKEI
jgi:hypothetical protein